MELLLPSAVVEFCVVEVEEFCLPFGGRPPGGPPPGRTPPSAGLKPGPPLPPGAPPPGLSVPSLPDPVPFWSYPGGEVPEGDLGLAPKGCHSGWLVSAIVCVFANVVDGNVDNGIEGACAIPGGGSEARWSIPGIGAKLNSSWGVNRDSAIVACCRWRFFFLLTRTNNATSCTPDSS